MRILNCTQHCATPEQLAAGVVDAPDFFQRFLAKRLTFEELPTRGEMEARAEAIAGMVAEWQNIDGAMIGGAPYFMPVLERALTRRGVRVCYAFSKRESVEVTNEDGTVTKTSKFAHGGFVWAN